MSDCTELAAKKAHTCRTGTFEIWRLGLFRTIESRFGEFPIFTTRFGKYNEQKHIACSKTAEYILNQDCTDIFKLYY